MRYDPDAVKNEHGETVTGAEKHVQVLRRRLRHLHQRIQQGRKDGRVLTYDLNEEEALQWALSIVDAESV